MAPFLEASRARRLTEGAGSDVADFVTAYADVRQRLVGKAAKFAKRAAIAEPALRDADRVHDGLPRMNVVSSMIAV